MRLRAPRVPFVRLTPRQLEVLAGIMEGQTDAEMMALLGISMSTLACHKRALFLRLGVSRKPPAAIAAARVIWAREAAEERRQGAGA